MSPVGELRAAILVAMSIYGLHWYQALPLALLGNMVPVFFLLWALPRLSTFLLSFRNPAGRFLNWRAERLRSSQESRFKKHGAWVLLPLVAVPLPFTGAWTGCLVAWLFDIPSKKALPPIIIGVLIAGVIMTVLTYFGIKLFWGV